MLGLIGASFALWSLMHGSGGLTALMATVADTLDRVRQALPESIADSLPTTVHAGPGGDIRPARSGDSAGGLCLAQGGDAGGVTALIVAALSPSAGTDGAI